MNPELLWEWDVGAVTGRRRGATDLFCRMAYGYHAPVKAPEPRKDWRLLLETHIGQTPREAPSAVQDGRGRAVKPLCYVDGGRSGVTWGSPDPGAGQELCQYCMLVTGLSRWYLVSSKGVTVADRDEQAVRALEAATDVFLDRVRKARWPVPERGADLSVILASMKQPSEKRRLDSLQGLVEDVLDAREAQAEAAEQVRFLENRLLHRLGPCTRADAGPWHITRYRQGARCVLRITERRNHHVTEKPLRNEALH